MLILAIESSAKPASVAVFEQTDDTGGGRLLGQYWQNSGFSHSRTLLVMVESLLRNLELEPKDIDLFAVSQGPGSFTGVRIGVSAVKGLAFGLDKEVCGVSTLEAMARQAMCEGTLICPVMDARRSQVYNAVFKMENNVLVRLCDDRTISIEDLAADLKNFGTELKKAAGSDLAVSYMPIGDGSDLVLAKLTGIDGLSTVLPSPAAKYQSAYGVALAAVHAVPMPAAELVPVYLRPSQAERCLNERKKN